MSESWKTARGDEWWYSDASRSMTASFGAGEAVTLSDFQARGSELTGRELLAMLAAALAQFPESRIYLAYSGITKLLLDALSAEGKVTFQVLDTGLGKDAELTAINASNLPSNTSLERTRDR